MKTKISKLKIRVVFPPISRKKMIKFNHREGERSMVPVKVLYLVQPYSLVVVCSRFIFYCSFIVLFFAPYGTKKLLVSETESYNSTTLTV